MSAEVVAKLLMLLARSSKNGENPLRAVCIALASAICAVVLLFAVVVYILTSPFELCAELVGFQSRYSGLVAQDTNIDASALTEEQIRLLTGDITDPRRQEIITTALQLVGVVPYFWGGKSAPGWNGNWGTLELVTAPGSATSNTYIPYGLDCSGFVNWVFCTALDEGAMAGYSTSSLWYESAAITEAELQPGDLVFKAPPSGEVNHMGIYLGKGADGKNIYIHCSYSGGGVVMNSYSGFQCFRIPVILMEEGDAV